MSGILRGGATLRTIAQDIRERGMLQYANQINPISAPRSAPPGVPNVPGLVAAPAVIPRIAPPATPSPIASTPTLITQRVAPPPPPSPPVSISPPPAPVTSPNMSLMIPNASPMGNRPVLTMNRRSVYDVAGPIPGVNAGGMPSGGVIGGLNDLVTLGERVAGIFRGSSGSGGPAPIPLPGGALPGGGVSEAGMGSAVGGLIGRAAGRVAKYIPGVVEGIVGYYVFDKVLGWIFHKGTPPHRRMNVLNQRALSRANRRVVGFSHIATKTLRQLGYHVSRTRHVKGKAKSFGGHKRKKHPVTVRAVRP